MIFDFDQVSTQIWDINDINPKWFKEPDLHDHLQSKISFKSSSTQMSCLLKPGLTTSCFSTWSLQFPLLDLPTPFHHSKSVQLGWAPNWQIVVFLKPSLCRPHFLTHLPVHSPKKKTTAKAKRWEKRKTGTTFHLILGLIFLCHGPKKSCAPRIHLKKFEALGPHTVEPTLIDLQGEGQHQQGCLHRAEPRRPNLPGHAKLVGRVLYVLAFFKMLIIQEFWKTHTF